MVFLLHLLDFLFLIPLDPPPLAKMIPINLFFSFHYCQNKIITFLYEKVFIISEIGINHNGDIDLAKKMIKSSNVE